jgi:endonuclease YncB( thermonuclease family)
VSVLDAKVPTTWTVPGVLVRIHDGDTMVVRADLGWHVQLETAVRVDGINAPELPTPEGVAARDYLINLLLPDGKGVLVSKAMLGTFEKYGRVLADVALPDRTGKMVDVAQAMLDAGHAVVWHGRGPKPV